MEDFKKKSGLDVSDKEIVFSQSIKAGKRIYYLDVKKNRKDEMFLAITESKKIVTGEGDESQVSFEKHKIFLYKEDFNKFVKGLTEAVDFVKTELMPDFDFDAFNHDTPYEGENGQPAAEVKTDAIATESTITSATVEPENPPADSGNAVPHEDVDKW